MIEGKPHGNGPFIGRRVSISPETSELEAPFLAERKGLGVRVIPEVLCSIVVSAGIVKQSVVDGRVRRGPEKV